MARYVPSYKQREIDRKKAEKERRKREKAEAREKKAVEKASKAAKLAKLAGTCRSASAQADAVWKLRKLDAQTELLALAQNSATPMLRCEAACRLSDRDRASELVSRDICAAFADPGMSKQYHWTSWIEAVKDEEKAYEAFQAGGDYRTEALYKVMAQAHGPTLRRLLIEAEDKDWFQTDRILEAYTGTREDWREITEKARSEKVVYAAVKHMVIGDVDVLQRRADAGSVYAARRLALLDPAAYSVRYVDKLSPEDTAKLIREKRLPQEKIEKLALEYPRLNAWNSPEGKEVYEAALDGLTDPELIAHLFLNKTIDKKLLGIQVWGEYMKKWNLRLLEALRDRPDVLTEYITTKEDASDYRYGVAKEALAYITDSAQLYRIAASGCYGADEAAKKLAPEELRRLEKESKSPSVVRYAGYAWRDALLESLNDDELLESLDWAIGYSRQDIILRSVKKLRSQPARLDGLLRLNKQYYGNEDAYKRLLSRIKDGPGLMKLCLEHAADIRRDAVVRLRELIGGAPEEETFVAACGEMFFTQTPRSSTAQWLLGTYFDIPAGQAAWQYGGEQYVKRLLKTLDGERELGNVTAVVSELADIYRNAPGSAGILAPFRGRKYRKHVDFIASCASESCDTTVDYVVELNK